MAMDNKDRAAKSKQRTEREAHEYQRNNHGAGVEFSATRRMENSY
jgi:hypothetical protein